MRGTVWGRAQLALLVMVMASACASTGSAPEQGGGEDAWRTAFMKRAEAVATPTNNASSRFPYGRPHPDAPAALSDFAFLVGEHRCETAAPRKVNPFDADEVVVVPFYWYGEYILNGRAIRDEWADINSTGSQTRIFDPKSGSWTTRWFGMGLLEGFGLYADRGEFVAKRQPDGTIIGLPAPVEYQGSSYQNIITFSEISPAGFEWLMTTERDGTLLDAKTWISCKRIKG